jgi:hypothetical protein
MDWGFGVDVCFSVVSIQVLYTLCLIYVKASMCNYEFMYIQIYVCVYVCMCVCIYVIYMKRE